MFEFIVAADIDVGNVEFMVEITGTGLSPNDISYQGIEPVEPIFEEINWRVKSATIVAKNTQSAAE